MAQHENPNRLSRWDNGSPIKRRLSSGIMRFAGWWSIFAGALALHSVCPICGSTGCPVGIGTTGIIAGLAAALKQWGGGIIRIIAGKVRRTISGSCGSPALPDTGDCPDHGRS
ncbi:MAG: hypothetical protein JW807_12085 [Spirochaetes bacterium]|nr:hypothetical protein [Spirochaetota bacterium]